METYLLCLVLGIVFTVTSANECTPSSNDKIEYASCPSNCSQPGGRIPGHDVFFNCSVGVKKDVDDYKKRKGKQLLPSSLIFDAPKIHGVETYWKKFKSFELVQCLKITFALPQGIVNPKNSNDWRLPKAVFLKFEGLPSSRSNVNEDRFYTKCPRERIFQFHNYTTQNFYEMSNPRELVFDCLIGLEGGSGYAITLQTAEGKMARYVTTVTEYVETKWRPAIMTFLNDTSHSLYTVIEKPDYRNITSYRIRLVKAKYGVVQTAEINVKERNSTVFINLTRGYYQVVVTPVCTPKCGKNANFSVKSASIDGSKLPWKPPDKDSPNYLEDTLEPMKVAAMVAGCIMGVTLLLAITYCIRRRPKCQERDTAPKASGLLLHPFRNDSSSREYNVVLKLEQYVNLAFECRVTNSSDIYKEHFNHIENLKKIVDNILKDSSFVLVLFGNNCFKSDATDLGNDFYSCVLKAAVERKRDHNDIRIIPLRFSFNSSNDISALPTTLNLTADSVLDLIYSPSKVYFKIHGQDIRQQNRKIQDENRSQWNNIWTELKSAVSQVRTNNDTEQCEQEPLLISYQNSGLKVGSEPFKSFPAHHGGDKSNVFWKFREINQETESVVDEDISVCNSNDPRSKDSVCNRKDLPLIKESERNKETSNNRLIIGQRKQSHLQTAEPLSLPPNFNLYFSPGSSGENDQGRVKTHENHQCNIKKGQSKISDEHNRITAFNVDESDSDSYSDDSVVGECNEELDLYISDKHILPVLHDSVNHHRYHYPHHCQNRVKDHRYHIRPEENSDFYQIQTFRELSMCNDSDIYGQRHLNKQRSPHTHRGVITHNQGLHSMFQYRPDDYISGNDDHQHSSSRNFEHTPHFDRFHFRPPNEELDLNPQGAFALADKYPHDTDHGILHSLDDRIPINVNPHHTLQLSAYQSPDNDRASHHDYNTQCHQHKQRHHRRFQEQHNLNGEDHIAHCNESEKQCLHKTQNSDSFHSSRLSFEAVDPPASKQEYSDQGDELKIIYGKSKEKASDQLQRIGSVSSLPTNIDLGKFAENFQNYSPVPPEDIDNITDSQIIDGFIQINKNNTC